MQGRASAFHARNVPDDVLKLVKENRGVVMVNFYSGFLTPEGARAMRLSVSPACTACEVLDGAAVFCAAVAVASCVCAGGCACICIGAGAGDA